MINDDKKIDFELWCFNVSLVEGVSNDRQVGIMFASIDLTLYDSVYMMELWSVAVIVTLVVYDLFLCCRCYAAVIVGCYRFDCWSLIFVCCLRSAVH